MVKILYKIHLIIHNKRIKDLNNLKKIREFILV